MAIHNDLGKLGEDMAAKWLLEKGFEILHRNWRHGYYEIDIIAKKETILHIIEVKIRNFSKYGMPEDAVTRTKFKQIQRATNHFLSLNPGYKWIQYGIIAINIFKDKDPEILFLQDVYL